MTAHIPLPQLALHSRGDLPFWASWRVERHLRICEDCARLSSDFVGMQDAVAGSLVELPSELNEAAWNRLAADMTANIHLGLEAGECVSVLQRRVPRPRLAFALAGLALVTLVAGLQKSVPPQRATGHTSEDTSVRTLEASSNGIAVHSAGRMLSVSAPPGIDVIQTVNTRGDMHSRYTDDTGVTVNAVYADAE